MKIDSLNQIIKKEEGIAVVIALGLTLLLLGLGIAFLTMSITEKRATNNQQSISLARMAAQSALNRALSQMKTKYMNERLGGISSVDNTLDKEQNESTARNELDAQLSTTINGIPHTPNESTTWIYIPSNDDSNNKYIARMAYVVIPDTGRLDPSASVDSGTLTDSSATEWFYNGTGVDSGYISVYGPTGVDTGRVGSQIYEIPLNSIDNSTTWGTYWAKLSATNADTSAPSNGLMAIGNRWNDIGSILSSLSIDDTSTDADTMRQIFSTYEPAIPEVYWIDSNSNTMKELGEMFHRFNLTRSDWDILTVASFSDTGAPESASSSDISNSTNYLPWLKNWKTAGDMGSDTANRNQVIANLIDYNDTDRKATTDYDTTRDIDYEPTPTYVGLEKCPYINEIKLDCQNRITVNGSTDWDFAFSFKITRGDVELVNMYDTSASQKFAIWITGSYTANLCWPTPSTVVSSTPNQSFSIKYTSGVVTTNPDSYSVTEIPSSSTSSVTVSYPFQIYASVTDFKISKIYVGLYDSADTTRLSDFSTLVNTPTSISDGNFTGGYTNMNKINNFTIDYEVKDPRQNLLPGDWVQSTSSNTISSPYTNSAFTNNVNGAGVDPENSGIQPWQISTAYIRNAPMKTPLELGVIHRGKAFQTLNLKKYDSSSSQGTFDGAGGNVYANGDANILDQVKTTSSLSTYGKVNINSDVDAVLWPLFAKISIGSSLDTPGTFTDINSTVSIDQAKSIATVVQNNTGTPIATRASILNNSVSSALTSAISSIQTTDKTQEEIIGKYINLTDASPGNIFYIVAVGEALRDIANKTQYGTLDEVLATVKIFAIVKRNPLTNEFTLVRTIYDNNENVK